MGVAQNSRTRVMRFLLCFQRVLFWGPIFDPQPYESVASKIVSTAPNHYNPKGS